MFDFLRQIPFKGHSGKITALAIAPNGQVAVTGAHAHQVLDKDAIVWDLPTGKNLRSLKGHGVAIYSAAYAPDSEMIATGGGGAVEGRKWVYDNTIRLWGPRGKPEGVFGEDLFIVQALQFSPDGRTILSGSHNNAPAAPKRNTHSLRLWNRETCKEIARFGEHLSGVTTVAFSPDGKRIIGGYTGIMMDDPLSGGVEARKDLGLEGRSLRAWDTSSGNEIDLFMHWAWVNAVAFDPTGDNLFTVGKGVICWDARTGHKVREFSYDGLAFGAALSPSGRLLAFGSGGRDEPGAPYEDCFVRVYDTADGTLISQIPHRYPVTALAFTPDGQHILAGGEFGELHFWPVGSQYNVYPR